MKTRTDHGESPFADFIRRLTADRIVSVSFIIILIYIAIASLVAGGVLYPHINLGDANQQYLSPSLNHPFGTDILGRDVLGRGLHGVATALSVGFVASIISLVIGTLLGALGGFYGGKVDALVVWIYTTVDSVPYILLIPALTFVLGRGLTNVYIAIGVTSWVTLCRLVRGEFLKHKDRDYVLAAKSLGASQSRQMFRHVLPNTAHIMIVQFGLGFVAAIKTEVILSYLGLGVDSSTPSWGLMLDDAKLELARPFWGNLAAATLLMFVLILALNLFNEGVRESLDPKLRSTGRLSGPSPDKK